VELRQNHTLMCDVIGIVDDDPSKVGFVLDGKRVMGTGKALEALVQKHAIKRVLIAIPTATGPQMVRILKLATEAKVEYKMVRVWESLSRARNWASRSERLP